MLHFVININLECEIISVRLTLVDKRLDPVKVTGVEISPDPVVSGKAATFKITGSTGMSFSFPAS